MPLKTTGSNDKVSVPWIAAAAVVFVFAISLILVIGFLTIMARTEDHEMAKQIGKYLGSALSGVMGAILGLATGFSSGYSASKRR
jgi:hypothetical protein